jgi:hypothetical protein
LDWIQETTIPALNEIKTSTAAASRRFSFSECRDIDFVFRFGSG